MAQNMATVGAEFRRWRRLDPVRFCVAGTLGSGASELGKLLAERYNLPHLIFDDLVEEMRNADTPIGQTIRGKLEEIEAALANPKAAGPFVLPSSVCCQVIEEAINTKPCEYRGYVLSGFPQSVEEATEFFCEDKPVDSDAAEAATNAKDAKKGKKGEEAAPTSEKVPRTGFTFDGVAIVHTPEEAAMLRMQGGDRPEESWMPAFKKRYERWTKENPEGGPGLAEFFSSKLGLEAAVAFEPTPRADPTPDSGNAEGGEAVADSEDTAVEKTVGELLEAAAVEVTTRAEASRQINNFMPAPPGPKAAEEEAPKEEAPSRDEASLRREEEELKKKREREEQLEQIKRDELAKLEKHSEPLRQYLMSFVVPTVTSGLVEVCRAQPEDPVGYLAEYLSVYSQLSKKRRGSASNRGSVVASAGGASGAGAPASPPPAPAPVAPVSGAA